MARADACNAPHPAPRLAEAPRVVVPAFALSLVVALAAAGCAPSADPCSSHADCPSGAQCAAGSCYERAGDEGVDVRQRELTGEGEGERTGEGEGEAGGGEGEGEGGGGEGEGESVDPGPPPFDGEGCQAAFYGDRVFLLCLDPTDLWDAQVDCAIRGLDLASIHSRDEAAAVDELLYDADVGERVWFGLHDYIGTLNWIDDSAVDYLNEPLTADFDPFNSRNCGVIDVDNSWRDENCSFGGYGRLCASPFVP